MHLHYTANNNQIKSLFPHHLTNDTHTVFCIILWQNYRIYYYKYTLKYIENFAINNIDKYKKFCKLSCYEPLLIIGKSCYNINLFKEVYNILRSEDKDIEFGIIEQNGYDVLYFANNFASAILLPILAEDGQKQAMLNIMNDFCYGGLANASCEEKNL